MTITEVSRSTATTYHFRGAPHGWATCTVNDYTGELLIQSDWTEPCGHRWDPRNLGEPSLTEFIARHRSDNFDYLVDKLLPVERRRRFDPEATIAAMRRRVIDARRAGTMSRADARELWGDVGALSGSDSRDSFFFQLVEFTNYPGHWHDERDVASQEAVALGTIILPALREACLREVARRLTVATTKESP